MKHCRCKISKHEDLGIETMKMKHTDEGQFFQKWTENPWDMKQQNLKLEKWLANILAIKVAKERGKGQKKKCDEIKANRFSNQWYLWIHRSKNLNTSQAQEIKKSTVNHIMIQWLRTSNEEKILKIMDRANLYPEYAKSS